jgi:hypothetical protein
MAKTQFEVEQQISTYLDKTSKHLFMTPDGYYLKVIPFTSNGKNYFAKILFGAHKEPLVTITPQLSDVRWKSYGAGSYQSIKTNIFGGSIIHKSVPNFKAMKRLMLTYKSELETYDGTYASSTNMSLIFKKHFADANQLKQVEELK